MRSLLFASLLLAFACGGDDGLTVRGHVEAVADGTPTGFQFVETTRLADLGRGEEAGTVMAGGCRLATGGGVTLTLEAPGATPDGVGMHRFEVSLPDEPTTADGLVVAQLGADDYTATVGAACTAAYLYRDDDDGAVGAEVDCTLVGPAGATAEVTAELHFGGCSFY